MSTEKPPRSPISKQTRVLVLTRDGYRCRFCGASADEVRLHVDHVYPHTRGGTDTLDNLATLCEDCNIGKSDLYLGNYMELVQAKRIPQPPSRPALSPPEEYQRDALRQILSRLVDSGVRELSLAEFAVAVQRTTRDGWNELFEPIALPTLRRAIEGAIANGVLTIEGDRVLINGEPKKTRSPEQARRRAERLQEELDLTEKIASFVRDLRNGVIPWEQYDPLGTSSLEHFNFCMDELVGFSEAVGIEVKRAVAQDEFDVALDVLRSHARSLRAELEGD